MRTRVLSAVLCCAAASVLMHASAASDGREGAWLVHATDPHLFVNVITNKTADSEKRKIERQRALNEAALKDALSRAATLVGVEGEPRALILTGDFDSDPCWIAGVPDQTNDENRSAVVAKCVSDAKKDERDKQVKQLSAILASSPVRDVYVLPGNNDIAREDAGDAALKYFNDFIGDVQKSITTDQKSHVQLHNLVGCYASGADAECVADIRNTPYRLLAAPSYSFKNIDDAALTGNDTAQQRQMQKFAGLVEEGRVAGRRFVIVTHIPNVDDPYYLAQNRYAVAARNRPNTKLEGRSESSTWNVTKPVMDEWTAAVSSEVVAAVLAGHLHDSHRDIYRQPYTWSTVDAFVQDRGKLFIAPPLAVKNQDMSPIQARGFSVVHLLPDRVQRELYWYDAEARTFSADALVGGRSSDDGSGFWHRMRARLWRPGRWLWRLATDDPPLARLAVILIAFLAAFLTVARVWQIPPDKNPILTDNPAPAATPFDASPFAGNFGKTVMAGLGGLVAETVLKSLLPEPPKHDKEFYVVWFVLFFFLLLAMAAVIRGLSEAMRARLALISYSTVPPPLPSGRSSKFLVWLRHWARRFWEWTLSWRVPLLTFLDTVTNAVQGKNQLVTRVFTDTIIDGHRNLVRVADTIRQQLNDLIAEKLGNRAKDVRVNISVLSADQSTVFYIAQAPGSSVEAFPKRSVAWIAVFTGKIRWYRASYDKNSSEIVLFDNKDKTVADDQPAIYLKSYYQPRDEDYKAFIVFPVPWPRRSQAARYVKGAIHISFRTEKEFNELWKDDDDPVPTDKRYHSEEKILGEWCKDEMVRAALSSAIVVLGELLRGFNENLFLASRAV